MSDVAAVEAPSRGSDLALFFALACGLTWALGLPLVSAWIRQVDPAPWALPLAGLSAFGPTIAALVVARRRREARQVLGRWRTHPGWIALGLALPALLHLPATLIEVALGGQPSQWFYPPVTPEQVAALVFFSIGEEFGWRGYAYPRAAGAYGPVAGAVLVGLVWTAWHLVMWVSPEGVLPSPALVARYAVELSLWSIVFAWVFERANRSMAVAIALHAGGHLDNVTHAPPDETRLVALRLLVLAVAAALAARSLTRARG